ncbi:AraC family transcriptional regulator [Pedobacter frigiditerrae]|uniref:AraC family transcriptional regulator n=1 Tax=Pedobacter frigiditerrae TaxID=2530452 RepID=A0A4R0N1V2_9SPHI|nr:AraC family transcriptional regulator [Pedobacter frigiditerrae]
MDRVLKYIFDNFNKEILLDEAAEMSHMNKYAFCRYFKSLTQKTFITFVNEVRIGYACKLLAETDQQISDLAYCCGFNNLSNFNKFFRILKVLHPGHIKKCCWRIDEGLFNPLKSHCLIEPKIRW